MLGAEFVGGGGGQVGPKDWGLSLLGVKLGRNFSGGPVCGGVKLGRNFGKIPAVQGLFAGILPKRIPRSAGLIPGLCKWKSQYPRYFPAPRGPWLQMTGALR